jgi:copper chaperone
MATYRVPDIHCQHCSATIREQVASVPGVAEVEVDVERGLVSVAGADVPDAAVRAAIGEAGYAVAD